MTSHFNIGRALLAGVIGTAVMTVIGIYGAPMMGIPPMNPAVMLAGAMGGNLLLGWMAHFMVGIILAVGFALTVGFLPGPVPLRGAIYALAPYLMAQVIILPMMGMPLFSGSFSMAMGSLIGHLAYGAVIGGVYGTGARSASVQAANA